MAARTVVCKANAQVESFVARSPFGASADDVYKTGVCGC